MYRFKDIKRTTKGFTKNQLNFIASTLVNAVNDFDIDLQLELLERFRSVCKLGDFRCIDIHVPDSNLILKIEPTTKAITGTCKRLNIKLERI